MNYTIQFIKFVYIKNASFFRKGIIQQFIQYWESRILLLLFNPAFYVILCWICKFKFILFIKPAYFLV